MRKPLFSLFIFIFCALASACDDELVQPNFVDQNPDEVEIRISNQSEFDFNQVSINTSSNEWNFGSVHKKGKSTYRKFDHAYPYFSLSFKVENKLFAYQPTSYSGYNKIPGGKYDALIYDVDTIGLTFAFRLEEN